MSEVKSVIVNEMKSVIGLDSVRDENEEPGSLTKKLYHLLFKNLWGHHIPKFQSMILRQHYTFQYCCNARGSFGGHGSALCAS